MALKNTQPQYVYGFPTPIGALFPKPVISTINPTVFDFGTVGQEWVNTSTNAVFFLTSVSNGQATWVSSAGGSGFFASLTVTPGPITLIGTTNINAVGAAVTTIGTGGTGAVNIGNATGNTAITGSLVVSGSINTINGPITAGNTAVSAVGAQLALIKSRANGVITSGDQIGNIVFAAFDGTGYTNGAAIVSQNSGTVAAGRIAGNLIFFTHPDAATAIVARMTISSAGNITVATPDAGTALSISGATTAISATGGDITIGAGDLNINTPGKGINLPGPTQIINGAGAPAAGLALAVGDVYINTTGSGTMDRMWIATGVGTWTYVVTGA